MLSIVLRRNFKNALIQRNLLLGTYFFKRGCYSDIVRTGAMWPWGLAVWKQSCLRVRSSSRSLLLPGVLQRGWGPGPPPMQGHTGRRLVGGVRWNPEAPALLGRDCCWRIENGITVRSGFREEMRRIWKFQQPLQCSGSDRRSGEGAGCWEHSVPRPPGRPW